MANRDVIALDGKQADLGIGAQQYTCANPRCDEQYSRPIGPGRRKDFHDDECRRSAERDLRRILAQLEHHNRQSEQLRARAAAYIRTAVATETGRPTGPTDAQRQAARDAVLVVRGMARFLPNHQGEFAEELLTLFLAVEPVVTI